jgi:Flp pilus assembly protein TadD
VIAGWLWFVGTLVPMIGLVQIGGQGMADRYTYLPSIGLAFAAAWAAAEAGKRAVAPALVVIVTLAVLTRAQVGVWRDSVSLFTHAIRVAGPSATAEVDLGDALEAQGKVADAMNAFEAAARLEPGHRAAENRIAGILSRQGRLEEAEAHYRAVLARLPSDPETLGNLGIVLAKQRRLDEAMTAFRAALAGDHQEPADVHTNLGNALLLSGRVEEAIAEYRESLRLAPGDRETEANLKVALERLNR